MRRRFRRRNRGSGAGGRSIRIVCRANGENDGCDARETDAGERSGDRLFAATGVSVSQCGAERTDGACSQQGAS